MIGSPQRRVDDRLQRRSHGEAGARAALAGNPSDGYGGAVLALAFGDFSAQAFASSAPSLRIRPSNALVEATLRRFARELAPPALATDLQWSTTVPRGVGLGGSSAIVIATLRSLCRLYEVSLDPSELAAFALSVETEDLNIPAGMQDRVAQAYGGLTFMDFANRRGEDEPHGTYQQLEWRSLPSLLIAWRVETARDSGSVHGELRTRFARGDPRVISGMRELAELARGARSAVVAQDAAELARCVDGSFDVRQGMMKLDPRHVAMVQRARHHGASVNYTGSGGAVIVVCADHRHRARVERALRAEGCATVSPMALATETAPRF